MSRKGNIAACLLFFMGLLCFMAVPSEKLRFLGIGYKAAQGESEDEEFGQIVVEEEELLTPAAPQAKPEVQVELGDSFGDEQYVRWEDGNCDLEKVYTCRLNNIWISVPDEAARAFGYPVCAAELLAEGEWETMDEWHDRDKTGVRYDAAFNAGLEETKRLVQEGYLQGAVEEFLRQYPELLQEGRSYKLQLRSGGRRDRAEDDTSWWELHYRLVWTAENGEIIPIAWLEIDKTIKAQGYPVLDDAEYSFYPDKHGIWRLLEDQKTDRGMVWIHQIPEADFSDEEKAKQFFDAQDAAFLLPEGADTACVWSDRVEEGYWYDYLIRQGETADYELTLAVPLMPEGSGGWYLASRIRKEAVGKADCEHALSVMKQTLRTSPYVYTVRKNDTLSGIAQKYMSGYGVESGYWFLAEINGIADPDLIYPGWQITLPENDTGKMWKAAK